jgi:hypothetical protein
MTSADSQYEYPLSSAPNYPPQLLFWDATTNLITLRNPDNSTQDWGTKPWSLPLPVDPIDGTGGKLGSVSFNIMPKYTDGIQKPTPLTAFTCDLNSTPQTYTYTFTAPTDNGQTQITVQGQAAGGGSPTSSSTKFQDIYNLDRFNSKFIFDLYAMIRKDFRLPESLPPVEDLIEKR